LCGGKALIEACNFLKNALLFIKHIARKEDKIFSWLRCNKQQNHITSLWYQTYRKFQNNIMHGIKNFSVGLVAYQKLRDAIMQGRSEEATQGGVV
jgi:hypothetical protein